MAKQKNSRDFEIGTYLELWIDTARLHVVKESTLDKFFSYRDQFGIKHFAIKADRKIATVIAVEPGEDNGKKVIAQSHDGLYFICHNVEFAIDRFQWHCYSDRNGNDGYIETYLLSYEAYNNSGRLLFVNDDGTVAVPLEPYYVKEDTGIAWHRNDPENRHCYSNEVDYKEKFNPRS